MYVALKWAIPFVLVSMASLSHAAPERVSSQSQKLEDIEYAQVNGISLRMDASLPVSGSANPAVILVHGGGWVRGDRRAEVRPLFTPLADAGLAWFSIDYRLANDITQFGVAVDDVESAIRFVKAHAAEYRIDPNRIALIGESAGGQLAAMAALSGEPGTTVRAVVALYTPTDLVSLANGSNLIPPQIRDTFKGTPFEQLILGRLAQLSPINSVKRNMPPFLFVHGTADRLVPYEQSTAMCSRMQAAGASCEVFPVTGAGHGIRWWESTISTSASAAYKKKIVSWLQMQLGFPQVS